MVRLLDRTSAKSGDSTLEPTKAANGDCELRTRDRPLRSRTGGLLCPER